MFATLIQLQSFFFNTPLLAAVDDGKGLSTKEKMQLAGGFFSMFSSKSEYGGALKTDYLGSLYFLLIFLVYIVGMSYVWYTLYREKQERLQPLTPESIKDLATNPDPDANGKAQAICSELDDYPPIDNKMIAQKIHARIREAISFGPTDPNILNRLNDHIEKLNAATRRKVTFPGFTTTEKHSCAMPLLLIFAVGIVSMNLHSHNCPSILIPLALIIIFGGLYAIALTPEYMRDKMNSSIIFRSFNRTHSTTAAVVKKEIDEMNKPVLYKVEYGFGMKTLYYRRPDPFGVILIVVGVLFLALLVMTLSVYFLLFLTVYFICHNYLFSSANTTNYCPDADNTFARKNTMHRILKYLLLAFTLLAALVTGFDLSGTIGMAFNGLVVLFVADCYFSYFNSLSSVALTLPKAQSDQMRSGISANVLKYYKIVLLCAFCWLAYLFVTDVVSIRIARQNEKIRHEYAETHRGEDDSGASVQSAQSE